MTELLIKKFIRDPENFKEPSVRKSYGTLGGIVGIICNLLLCALKISAGAISGSISIVADGLNNLSDMGSSLVTMIGFKLAGKPADSDHPFGHGRMEYMSAFIVAVMILIVGVDLFESSVKALFSGEKSPAYSLISIIILAVSVGVKFWMYLFNRKIGKKISSESLIATSKDSFNDMLATTAILISVGISMAIKLPFNLDAVMGIFVSLFILWAGYSSAKDTIDEILGKPPEKELINGIEQTVMSFEEFIGIHDLIVHSYGPGRQFASVHVEVPHDIDIVKCHEQIDLCEKLVRERLDIELVIHMDPIDNRNEVVSMTKSAIAEKIRGINEKLTLHDFRMTPISDKRTNLIFDVVVPPDVKISHQELNEEINRLAKTVNQTFQCVITFDNAYV